VASLSQGRTAAAQCGLFTYKSVPVIFEPPCIKITRVWLANQDILHTVLAYARWQIISDKIFRYKAVQRYQCSVGSRSSTFVEKSYLLVTALLAVSNWLSRKLRVPGTHILWKYDCISSFNDHM